MDSSGTSQTSFTPIAVKVDILNDLFENRFPDSGSYSNYFWEMAILGVVQAHLVNRGDISLDIAELDITTAFSVLLEHWFGHAGTDIGFTSLEEIESDDTRDRLENMGIVEPE